MTNYDYTDYDELPAYILSEKIISISMNWIELGIHVDIETVIDYNKALESRLLATKNEEPSTPDPIFISKRIPEIIYKIMRETFESNCIGRKFKFLCFNNIMQLAKNLKHPDHPKIWSEEENQRRTDLFKILVNCMVFGTKFSPTSRDYRKTFQDMFRDKMFDHILREKLKDVADALARAELEEGQQEL